MRLFYLTLLSSAGGAFSSDATGTTLLSFIMERLGKEGRGFTLGTFRAGAAGFVCKVLDAFVRVNRERSE